MRKFTTQIVDAIRAKELVEELIINDLPVLEQFELYLTGTTYLTEVRSLLTYIEHFANGGNIGKKCKILKGGNKKVTEYEFISKHLRLYGIQMPGKKLIIYGGIKRQADSSDNITAFRLICYEYLDTLNL